MYAASPEEHLLGASFFIYKEGGNEHDGGEMVI